MRISNAGKSLSPPPGRKAIFGRISGRCWLSWEWVSVESAANALGMGERRLSFSSNAQNIFEIQFNNSFAGKNC